MVKATTASNAPWNMAITPPVRVAVSSKINSQPMRLRVIAKTPVSR